VNYVDHPHYAHLAERASERVVKAERPALFPAPEVSSRDSDWPADLPVPRAVLAVERLAELHGVRMLRQYSCGWAMHAGNGRPTSKCHFVGLRFLRGDGVAAYAIYRKPVGGAGAWTWHNIRTTRHPLATITELHAWITHPVQPMTA
jgi:hypothetical protein